VGATRARTHLVVIGSEVVLEGVSETSVDSKGA
jgi:hypothetical protein